MLKAIIGVIETIAKEVCAGAKLEIKDEVAAYEVYASNPAMRAMVARYNARTGNKLSSFYQNKAKSVGHG